MIDHDEVLQLAAESVDSRLAPDDAAALEAHVRACPACRASSAGLIRDHWGLHRLEPAPVPPRVRARVVAAARGRRGLDVRPLLVAAILLVGGLAGALAGAGALRSDSPAPTFHPPVSVAPSAAPSHPVGATIAFAPVALSAVPGAAGDVDAGDLDGDGDADLVVGGADGAETMSVLLGDGSGRFGLGGIFPAYHPRGAKLVDLDLDGALDYVATGAGRETIAILFGDGDGGFAGPALLPADLQPREVVVGSFDRDRWPDLAVANASGDVVTLLMGAGGGAFRDIRNVPAGDGPWALVAADLDGDGRTDLAVVNKGPVSLHALWGYGAGRFSDPAQIGLPVDPEQVAAADLDRDGDVDLVTANAGPDTIGIYRAEPAGPFFVEETLPAPHVGEDGPGPVAIADLDGDGWPEVVVGFGVHDEVGIWRGDGAGGLLAPFAIPAGDGPTSLTIGDVNGDGRLDIVTGNVNDATVGVLLQR